MAGVRRQQRQRQRQNVREAGPAPQHHGLQPAAEEASRGLSALNTGRGQAQDAMGMSRAAAMGEGPSVAQAQLQAGRQAGLVDQMGMMAQQQGTGLAAQQRQASGMGAANQMGLARDTASLRANEIAQARGEYAAQAQAQQQMGLQQHLAGQGMQQQALGQQYDGQMGYQLATRDQDMKALEGRRNYVRGIVGDAVGGVTGIAGAVGGFMSDERVKVIEDSNADDEAIDAVRGLASVRYRYKDKKHGPTDKSILGFTAQDLERSDAGKSVIRETKDGKSVDVAGSISLALSGLAAVVRRLDKVEASRA